MKPLKYEELKLSYRKIPILFEIVRFFEKFYLIVSNQQG